MPVTYDGCVVVYVMCDAPGVGPFFSSSYPLSSDSVHVPKGYEGYFWRGGRGWRDAEVGPWFQCLRSLQVMDMMLPHYHYL